MGFYGLLFVLSSVDTRYSWMSRKWPSPGFLIFSVCLVPDAPESSVNRLLEALFVVLRIRTKLIQLRLTSLLQLRIRISCHPRYTQKETQAVTSGQTPRETQKKHREKHNLHISTLRCSRWLFSVVTGCVSL